MLSLWDVCCIWFARCVRMALNAGMYQKTSASCATPEGHFSQEDAYLSVASILTMCHVCRLTCVLCAGYGAYVLLAKVLGSLGQNFYCNHFWRNNVTDCT